MPFRNQDYPGGTKVLDPDDAISSPALTDRAILVRGDDKIKNIALSALLGNMAGLFFKQYTYTVSGAIDANANFVAINNATPATAIALTIAAPAAGRFLVITKLDAGTASNTVSLTAGAFDAQSGHSQATFNAKHETLVLFGLDSSRFAIIENIGSVSIGTPA
jgi:hypothetical protein